MSDASLMESHGAAVHGKRSGRGFTLIELLVTLSVAAILLGLAVPAFSSYVKNSRLTTEADTLLYALTLARSEAVKLDTSVEVCASNDRATCSGTWADGWIVLCPANCPAALGPSPALLQAEPPINASNSVTEEIAGATAVGFLSAGQTTGANFQFVFCDSRGPGSGRDVEINSVGEIAAASNPGETVAGAPLGAC